MDLSGDGRVPVMHFGMNGMLMVSPCVRESRHRKLIGGLAQLKGREPDWYIRRPKRSSEYQWPPKASRKGLARGNSHSLPPRQYLKLLLKLEPQERSVGDEPLELAFVDCALPHPSTRSES